MAIIPYKCKKHGDTTAYAYTIKSEKHIGWHIKACRECRAEQVRAEWQRIKQEVIRAYGGKCECCGETEPAFLTLDHIRGNGAQERRETHARGWRFYIWLRKRGYPKNGYRLLCWNCNCARHQFGECPHRR
jgi:hypothetical protein